jgi:alkanesulfonate monooxygenase SsuD/methylene tetrahydromethanopterin reductase-like flavin-dependent oxidoreductase (luciferase family)/putative sterol carrier protein
MRFGLFYELQLPRPWDACSEERCLKEALEQIELADRVGIDYVWQVEHHFLEEYSHSSAPEVFLAAASQRTERIRLGHGIVQIPPAFNHPARVAERIATLDLLSGGRVDFGTGQGSSQVELGGFLVDRELKHAQWEEMLGVIVRMMTEEPFGGHAGRFLTVPPRNVVPKPKQKPHPPLWVACSRRETILQAARRGLGALSFSFVEPEQAKTWVDEYYALIASEECVPAGLTVNPQVAVVVPFMCHQDEQTAIDRGIDGAHFLGYSLAYYYVFGKHQPGRTNVWDEFTKHRVEYGFAREIIHADNTPLGIQLLQHGLGSFRGAVGTPAQISDLLERYERAGVDQVIFAAQAGHNQHEHICESLDLFAWEVLPAFAERGPALEAAKRERLAGAIEQALARRSALRLAPSDYFITPKGETVFNRGAKGQASALMTALSGGAQETLFARFVRGRSDTQLELIMPVLAWLIFKGMERAFRPDRAYGFSGEIQYDLQGRDGARKWTIRIADGKARARIGPSERARVTLRMSVPTFARMSAGVLDPMSAILEQRLEVEGDVDLVSRLGEMFGAPSRY